MSQADEPDATAAQRGAQRLNRNLPMLVAGQNLDDRTRPLRYVQIGDVVASVLGCRREDAIAGLEPQGLERHIPTPRGVLNERDLVALAADQPRHRIIRTFQFSGMHLRRFIAPISASRFKWP
jgi:hypothetical protein